jgi:hypothetical protein
MLNGLGTFVNDAVTPATIIIRQTTIVLATISINATPFAAASNDSMIVTAPPFSANASATGTANNFQLKSENLVLSLSGTISAIGGGGDVQVPAVAITSGASQRLNTFILRMAATGLLSVEASFTFA